MPEIKGTMITLEGGARVLLPDNHDKAKCRACGEPIIFAITQKGYRMPIERQMSNHDYDSQGKWVSHFATCPEAQRFRKGKKG